MVDTVDSLAQLKVNLGLNDSQLKALLAAALPLASILDVSDATVAMSASLDGFLVRTTRGSAVSVPLPANTPVGVAVTIAQWGAGEVTFSAATATGATMRQADGLTKIRKQYCSVTAIVVSNSGGSSAEWWVQGDMK